MRSDEALVRRCGRKVRWEVYPEKIYNCVCMEDPFAPRKRFFFVSLAGRDS